MSNRKYLALCVSIKEEKWELESVPFYCLTDSQQFQRSRSKERIDYLADKWNRCHEAGLSRFPDSTHVINVGSQYISQMASLRKLIDRYDELDSEIILAGNVWAKKEDRLFPYKTTYDTWAYPDLAGLTWRLRQPNQLVQVESVAMPCIYPADAWKKHRFHNPETLNDGIWYNQFCRESGLPTFADLAIAFYRTRHDSNIVRVPIGKRLRVAFGVRKRLLKRFSKQA